MREHKGWIVVLLVFLGIAVLLLYGLHRFTTADDLSGCGETPTAGECAAADAIVVISGGDTRSRTDKAVELYKHDWAPVLIVSGAAEDPDSPSNAEAMRQQAIEQGVPPAKILLDETAQNTDQNAAGAAELARSQGLRDIIVVTSPYHLVRTKLTFERAFADFGTVRAHPSTSDDNWPSTWWLTPAGWYLVGSELVKTSIEFMQGVVRRE